MNKTDIRFIFYSYVTWFFLLLLILFFATQFVQLEKTFLGGGSINYLSNPYFWVWSNFDGNHYVSIAKNGYGYAQHAFFPLYPAAIGFIGRMLGGNLWSYNLSGIIISHISFLIALIGFYKLLRIDFKNKFVKKAIILLLIFPTSFYFVSVYTESLFLMFSVWSLYFARKGNWLFATICGILLTATRFVGLIILPVLLVEWFVQKKEKSLSKTAFPEIILAAPTGLLAYMYYLQNKVHDMFAFFNNLSLFGEQRSAVLITLPQVIYRYVFKILPGLNTTFFPVIFSTFFEFAIGGAYFFISLLSFFKVRLSYTVFLLLGYLIPTFSGSFSSIPRYVLVLFPAYILLVKIFDGSVRRLFAFYLISFILLIVSFTLFARGYWIS